MGDAGLRIRNAGYMLELGGIREKNLLFEEILENVEKNSCTLW
jgi:hypothetical protein